MPRLGPMLRRKNSSKITFPEKLKLYTNKYDDTFISTSGWINMNITEFKDSGAGKRIWKGRTINWIDMMDNHIMKTLNRPGNKRYHIDMDFNPVLSDTMFSMYHGEMTPEFIQMLKEFYDNPTSWRSPIPNEETK